MNLKASTLKYGLLGCGTMGKCILFGLLDNQSIEPSSIIASVQSESSLEQLSQECPGIKVVLENEKLISFADVILLCVKPQLVNSIMANLNFDGKIIISICAGVTISMLKKYAPGARSIIRAMPNTPCKIRQGMVVLSSGSFTGGNCIPGTKDLCIAIFSPLGRVRLVDEKLFDAVTALSGSGPAFACVVLEAFADGGVMMGIPRSVAIELAAQTLQGAARLVLETKKHPAEIKDEVTTPGGCTIAGLLAMEDGKIRSVIARAIQEATNVASGLGKQ